METDCRRWHIAKLGKQFAYTWPEDVLTNCQHPLAWAVVAMMVKVIAAAMVFILVS